MAVHVAVRNYEYKGKIWLSKPIKQAKETIYVMENIWAKGTENDEVHAYMELNSHKTMNIIHLKNAGLSGE